MKIMKIKITIILLIIITTTLMMIISILMTIFIKIINFSKLIIIMISIIKMMITITKAITISWFPSHMLIEHYPILLYCCVSSNSNTNIMDSELILHIGSICSGLHLCPLQEVHLLHWVWGTLWMTPCRESPHRKGASEWHR